MANPKYGYGREGTALGKISKQAPAPEEVKHHKKKGKLTERQLKDKIAATEKKIKQWQKVILPDGRNFGPQFRQMVVLLSKEKAKYERQLVQLQNGK